MNLLIKEILLNRERDTDEGFTLIELLVVIIIIGILAAIALPSFLNQANKARQSEAETYVGSVNRGQQAYFLENSAFAIDIATLGIGIPTTTEYYEYQITDVAPETATINATPIQGLVRSYAGRAFVTINPDGNNTTSSVVCAGNPGEPPPNVTVAITRADCP